MLRLANLTITATLLAVSASAQNAAQQNLEIARSNSTVELRIFDEPCLHDLAIERIRQMYQVREIFGLKQNMNSGALEPFGQFPDLFIALNRMYGRGDHNVDQCIGAFQPVSFRSDDRWQVQDGRPDGNRGPLCQMPVAENHHRLDPRNGHDRELVDDVIRFLRVSSSSGQCVRTVKLIDGIMFVEALSTILQQIQAPVAPAGAQQGNR